MDRKFAPDYKPTLGVQRRRERAPNGTALADRRDSVFLMTKVCTHGRDATVALRQLDESLRRLRTDHLDLWQVHECVYYNDPHGKAPCPMR